VEQITEDCWKIIGRPGKMLRIDAIINYHNLQIKVVKICENGMRIIKINMLRHELLLFLDRHGELPLPPYIKTKLKISSQYQTVYSKITGSIAAPTAGLHFTEKLLRELKAKGVEFEFVTLHVGLGTFLPIKTEKIEDHQMHSENYSISKQTADRLNKAVQKHQRIIAVGTTSVRVLESNYNCRRGFKSGDYSTCIFIKPKYKWKVVDALITNFHTPKSTLLLLVFAFAGVKNIKKAYQHAIKHQYRFFSFGDAMFIE
jgi:S-adenosylmethionine:tRNA ribosyltransferase-isomerase